jgi:tetratricopeptide (TPR) repeat protein
MTLIFTIPLAIVLTLGVSVASAQRVGLAEVDRQTALTHLRAGQEALATERYEVAEREFREAIRLDPRLELAYYGLGQVFMATKRYPHAIDAFSSCRDLFLANLTEDHDQRLLYERRLDDQLQSKRDELRLLQTGRVRMANPTSSVDRVRTEIAQLERLRQRSRESAGNLPPFILTALGSAYFRTGAFADAEREWRRAAVVDPNIGEIHNNLAVVCMLTGRYEEAEREIELAQKAGFKVSAKLKEDLRSRRK